MLESLRVFQLEADVQPRTLAPHVWIKRGNEQISTLDLFDSHFTLLAGSDGAAWKRAAEAAAPSWPPLIAHVIGTNGEVSDPDGNWHAAYGIDTDGAVLVRPDGYVAWRSRSAASNPQAVLRAAFEQLLGRVPEMA